MLRQDVSTSPRNVVIGVRIAAALACLGLALTAGPPVALGAGDPVRADSMTEPVYLVHGYGAGNCKARWAPAIVAWRSKGWRGRFHAIGYYGDDRACDTSVGAATRDTSITELGRRLAWDIHRRYSRAGTSVDVVGHSMGGLIARVALTGVQQRWRGFPPYLHVEDAVTVGTPHLGVSAGWVTTCGDRQCVQMRPGSSFLRRLARHPEPQSRQGTDWTLIGSDDDATVSPGSALGMRAPHLVRFGAGQGVTHRDVIRLWRNDRRFHVTYWNRRQSGWRVSARGRAPLFAAGGAIYRAFNW